MFFGRDALFVLLAFFFFNIKREREKKERLDREQLFISAVM